MTIEENLQEIYNDTVKVYEKGYIQGTSAENIDVVLSEYVWNPNSNDSYKAINSRATAGTRDISNSNEVFNDYEYNSAGSRGFAIKTPLVDDNTTYEFSGEGLRSQLEKLAIGDVYSVIVGGNYADIGTITAIDLDAGSVKVTKRKNLDGTISDDGLNLKISYTPIFKVVKKRTAGTVNCGSYAHSEGSETEAQMVTAHAEGNRSVAGGKYSHAEGNETYANGWSAHSEGYRTRASGHAAHAEGKGCEAYSATGDSDEGMHAEGYNTKSVARGSHSEGNDTLASGQASHAGGWSSESRGKGSFAHGWDLLADKDWQAVFGSENGSSDGYFVVGIGQKKNGLVVERDGSLSIYKTGDKSNSAACKGYVDSLVGNLRLYVDDKTSNLPTNLTNGSNDWSLLSGAKAVASGYGAFAHGYSAKALGQNSFANGGATAEGDSSFASGNGKAYGTRSCAIGDNAEAKGNNSAAFGQWVEAKRDNALVCGQFSKTSDSLFIVGNGTAQKRNNAFEVTAEGKVMINGQSLEDFIKEVVAQ